MASQKTLWEIIKEFTNSSMALYFFAVN